MGNEYRYRPGQVVPGTGLKIIHPLGSGGMGSVYEVEEISVEAPFVMKVVHPQLLYANGSEIAERMRREAKTLAKLSHRNIVRVYRAGVTAETPALPFYVMDRLSGYSLRQVLQWHRAKGVLIPVSWFFWIASSLLQALDHAHRNGVIHRDVKPDNLFLHYPAGQKPVVKLLDFGIMLAISDLSDEKRLTAGGFAGTYSHAAPEQFQGGAPAPSLDLYTAGIVLFEMLAGRHPFEDSRTPESMALAHLHGRPPSIAQWRRDAHPRLVALVAQMLAKQPQQRPASAREALDTLASLKMDWMQDPDDTDDPAELQFDADIGERWPTNIGESVFTSDDAGRKKKGRGERQSGPPRQGKRAVAHSPVPWSDGNAASGRSMKRNAARPRPEVSKVRLTNVLIAAVGFAILTAIVTSLLIGRSTAAPQETLVQPLSPTVSRPAEAPAEPAPAVGAAKPREERGERSENALPPASAVSTVGKASPVVAPAHRDAMKRPPVPARPGASPAVEAVPGSAAPAPGIARPDPVPPPAPRESEDPMLP